MRLESGEIFGTPLAKMLAKAGRGDLIREGFDIDDGTLAQSRAISRDPDHAIYHALFDRGAPHAVTISPLQPPDEASKDKELLRWVVAKQAESAALDRANAEDLATLERAGVSHAADRTVAAAEASSDELRDTILTSTREIWVQATEATERRQHDSAARLNFAMRAEGNAARRDRAGMIRSWIQIAVLIVILAELCVTAAKAQNGPASGGPASPLILIGQNAAVTQFTRMAGPVTINCSTGMSCSFSGGVWALTATPSGAAWGSVTGTLANQADLNTALGLALAKASNLSDLASVSTARTNLGLGTAATQASTAFLPAGLAGADYAATDFRCNTAGGATAGYNCATNIGVTETLFANGITIAGAATANTVNGTWPGFTFTTQFDVAIVTSTAQLKLKACSTLLLANCVTIWTANAVTAAPTIENKDFICHVLGQPVATTFKAGCAAVSFPTASGAGTITTGLPTGSANWLFVWSVTYGGAGPNASVIAQLDNTDMRFVP